MQKSICKYQIPGDEFTKSLPKGANIVHVNSGPDLNGHFIGVFWAIGNPKAGKEVRRFFIIPTGGDFNARGAKYWGTFRTLITEWHLFERTNLKTS